ncbi:MAG: hypothetical protein HOK80_02875 [Candidatus Cloacimonetes bacterium]|mgnify:CR=1 FL=1|jgi:hypothetical protein|nr:hypothetical protein [Candidatus Cloacimonadota bacterium]
MNSPDWKNFYENILVNLGIQTRIDEKQFNVIYKRYKELGGGKELFYDRIKKKLKKYGL